MPREEHSQSFSVNSQSGRMTQTEKMQKEADHYTKKYEWERRNLLTLQGVESKLQGEIEGLKKNVASLKKESDEGEIKLMFTKMRNLQKQIDIVRNVTILERQAVQLDDGRDFQVEDCDQPAEAGEDHVPEQP